MVYLHVTLNKVMIYSDINGFIDTFENSLMYYSNDLGTILVIDKSNKLQGIYSIFEGRNPVYVKPKYFQILKFYKKEKLLKIKCARNTCPNFINYLLENGNHYKALLPNTPKHSMPVCF